MITGMRASAAIALMGMVVVSCAVAEPTPSPAQVRGLLAPCDDAIAHHSEPSDGTAVPVAHAYCSVLTFTWPSGWEAVLALIVISDRADDPLTDRTALVYLTGRPGTSTYQTVRGGGWPQVDLSRHSLLTWNGATSGDGTGPCGPNADAFLTARELHNFAAQATELGASCSEAGFGGPSDIGAWAAAEELEAIRGGLGIDRFDILSESYGTAVAEAYLYSHSARVRRAVLDGPVALQAPWPARLSAVGAVLRDGGNRLALSCSARACLDVLRDVPESRGYDAIRDAVLAEERPVGDSGLSLTPVMFDQATELALRRQASAAEWEAAIDDAFAGDGGPLWRLGELLYTDLDQAAYYRSLCADIHRPDDARDYAVADDPLLFAYSSALAPCARFPQGVVRPAGLAGDPEPEVLILASRHDPLAPASLIAADGFLDTHGSLCETDVIGHTSSNDPGIRALIEEFLSEGGAEAIAARCGSSSS